MSNSRPSPALVVALLALFVSLGGVSYGVATGSIDSREIRNNSIMSRDIKNNTINGRDIRRGAVFGSDIHRSTIAGADVRDGGLTGADLRNGSVTGADVLESSLGSVPAANTANSASTAGTAESASTLAGLGPDAFLRSSRIQFAGPVATDTTTQTTLLSFPDLGLEVRTDGDIDAMAEIRVVNLNSAGGRQFLVTYGADDQNQTLVTPGMNAQIQPGDDIDGGEAFIFVREPPGGGVLVSCGFSAFDGDRRGSCLAITS